MQQVKIAIESFGVGCGSLSKVVQTDYSPEIYFHINRNKKNILRFQNNIGFRLNQGKIAKLQECCSVIRKSLSR